MSMFSCQPTGAVPSTEPLTAFNVTQGKQHKFLLSDPEHHISCICISTSIIWESNVSVQII